LGATPAIGSLQDVDFLTDSFTGADIVYLMEPGDINDFFDHNLDFIAAKTAIGSNYKKAIERTGVNRVIHLSSNGAHMEKGNGMLAFHYNIENILRQLPPNVIIKFIRAAAFYQNVFYSLQTIRSQSAIFANYGEQEIEPWVSTLDIADAIAEEMESPFDRTKIRYIASDEMSPAELTQLIARAIGKPKIDWIVLTDEQLLENMLSIGMNPESARLYVEMTASRRGGKMFADYFKNRPEKLGNRKIKDFINDNFPAAYNG